MKRTKQSTFAKRERQEKATGFAPVGSEDMSKSGGAQFTPGPWVVKSTDEDINTKTIIDSNEFWIAKVLNFNRASDDIRESQANAHLIAAAPALYEALQIMVRAANVDEIDPLAMFASIERAKAALELAEGRQG